MLARLTKSKSTILVALLFCVLCSVAICSIVSTPTHALDTVLFGNIEDDGKGCGIYMIVTLVIDILSGGVLAVAVIGLAIFGISYLTSAGDVTRIVKAKKRLVEIIFGMVLYIFLWSLYNFLIPGGHFTISAQCPTTPIGGTTATVPNKYSNGTFVQTTPGTGAANSGAPDKGSVTSKTNGERILRAAESVASFLDKNNIKYDYNHGYSTKSSILEHGVTNCAGFAVASLKEAGFGKNSMSFYLDHGVIKGSDADYVKSHFTVIYTNGKSLKTLVKEGTLQPGDIIGPSNTTHTEIYAGKKNGSYIAYSGGSSRTDTGKHGGTFVASKITNTKRDGDTSIGVIIRAK